MGNSPSNNREESLKSSDHGNLKDITENGSLHSVVDSITVPKQMIIQMTEYSLKVLPKEAIGLLVGKEIRENELILNKAVFVTSGDEISVSFTDDDFKVFDKILHQDTYCIGWWHSHPGYGLFLSQTDIRTQVFSFQLHNEKAVALVLDPTILKDGIAIFKCFQVVKESSKDTFSTQEIVSYIR
ncbi:MAG: Mov34/MPN/PAD-1 family protein [Candidatus Hodarchaeales archaeon]